MVGRAERVYASAGADGFLLVCSDQQLIPVSLFTAVERATSKPLRSRAMGLYPEEACKLEW
jgi:hypothetical protein